MTQTPIYSHREKPGSCNRCKIFLSIFSFFILAFIGCKPTEQGYKNAYDAALNKREAAMGDMGVNLPKGALQQVDGPQLRKMAGGEFYFIGKNLSPMEEGKTLPGNYNVVAGEFKMPTNCRALVATLREEGFEAFVAEDKEEKFYSVAGSFDSEKEAADCYKKLQEMKDRVYVGLPGAPVIIYSRK